LINADVVTTAKPAVTSDVHQDVKIIETRKNKKPISISRSLLKRGRRPHPIKEIIPLQESTGQGVRIPPRLTTKRGRFVPKTSADERRQLVSRIRGRKTNEKHKKIELTSRTIDRQNNGPRINGGLKTLLKMIDQTLVQEDPATEPTIQIDSSKQSLQEKSQHQSRKSLSPTAESQNRRRPQTDQEQSFLKLLTEIKGRRQLQASTKKVKPIQIKSKSRPKTEEASERPDSFVTVGNNKESESSTTRTTKDRSRLQFNRKQLAAQQRTDPLPPIRSVSQNKRRPALTRLAAISLKRKHANENNQPAAFRLRTRGRGRFIKGKPKNYNKIDVDKVKVESNDLNDASRRLTFVERIRGRPKPSDEGRPDQSRRQHNLQEAKNQPLQPSITKQRNQGLVMTHLPQQDGSHFDPEFVQKHQSNGTRKVFVNGIASQTGIEDRIQFNGPRPTHPKIRIKLKKGNDLIDSSKGSPEIFETNAPIIESPLITTPALPENVNSPIPVTPKPTKKENLILTTQPLESTIITTPKPETIATIHTPIVKTRPTQAHIIRQIISKIHATQGSLVKNKFPFKVSATTKDPVTQLPNINKESLTSKSLEELTTQVSTLRDTMPIQANLEEMVQTETPIIIQTFTTQPSTTSQVVSTNPPPTKQTFTTENQNTKQSLTSQNFDNKLLLHDSFSAGRTPLPTKTPTNIIPNPLHQDTADKPRKDVNEKHRQKSLPFEHKKPDAFIQKTFKPRLEVDNKVPTTHYTIDIALEHAKATWARDPYRLREQSHTTGRKPIFDIDYSVVDDTVPKPTHPPVRNPATRVNNVQNKAFGLGFELNELQQLPSPKPTPPPVRQQIARNKSERKNTFSLEFEPIELPRAAIAHSKPIHPPIRKQTARDKSDLTKGLSLEFKAVLLPVVTTIIPTRPLTNPPIRKQVARNKSDINRAFSLEFEPIEVPKVASRGRTAQARHRLPQLKSTVQSRFSQERPLSEVASPRFFPNDLSEQFDFSSHVEKTSGQQTALEKALTFSVGWGR
jgi:hypothetical protein